MTNANPPVKGDLMVIEQSVAAHEWITSENVPLLYINNAEISASIADFTIRMGIVQQVVENRITVRETVKIIMSPQQAKLVADALAKIIQEYERRLGSISVIPIS